jgi:phosphoserine phosphatase RsbU/P
MTDEPAFHAAPILIVEDNEVNRVALERALSSRGFTNLLATASAEEALLRMEPFAPELIITDVVMPGMDGFEYCRTIRQQPQYRDLPILVQTVISEPQLRFKAFQDGATDFVSKPIYPDELYARVKVHLLNRLYLKSLTRYKRRIENELESARQMQESILPQPADISDIERACGIEVASYFKPSSELGGDFWGIKRMSSHQTACWLVDFSGHGVAAALNAFRLQAHLKEPSDLTAQPGEYLSHFNEKLLRLLATGQFATMFYGIVDTQADRLFYACACSPNPIVLRPAGKHAEVLSGAGQPLGIVPQAYETQSVPFLPGDTLVLYSDAFTETHDAGDACITEKDIMQMLQADASASAAGLVGVLIDRFNRHSGGLVADDLTLCVIKRRSLA